MVLRAVKLVIQTALLLQVLQRSGTCVKVAAPAVSETFDDMELLNQRSAPGMVHSAPTSVVSEKGTDDFDEERGLFSGFSSDPSDYKDEDFKTSTPVPGTEARPPTAELLASMGSRMEALVPEDMKKAARKITGEASGSSETDEDPTEKKKTAKKSPKDVSSADSGSEDALFEDDESAEVEEESASAGDESEPTSKKTEKKQIEEVDSGSVDASLEAGGSDEEGLEGFDELLAGLFDGKGNNMSDTGSLDSLALDSSASGSAADILGMFGGKGAEPDLSMEDFMKAVGGKLGLGGGGLMSLFGGDPTKPQHKEIDDANIILGELYGGKEHGEAFSDINNIKFGQMILNITLRGNKRVDRIELSIMTQEVAGNLVHGGNGGGIAQLEPELGDTITQVEVHWDKYKRKTRIFYMMLTTSGGKTISAGTKTANSAVLKAPPDYQFAGFHGRADGDGIYSIGAIYTKTGAQDLEVVDVMDVPDNGTSDIYNYDYTIRNWVGPAQPAADSACYQVRHGVSSMNTCPTGYKKDKAECIAQCPLGFPIECWRECIPQNTDCTQEILSKAVSVAATALSLASMGTFGALFASYKTFNFVLFCAVSVMNSVRNLMFYLRYRVTTIPRNDIERLMDQAFMLQIVILDLPMAVSTCLGIRLPQSLTFSVFVLTGVSLIVMFVVMIGEALFASKDNILLMLRESGALNKSLKADTLELKDFINSSNSTCGHEMRLLTNRVIAKVHEVRNKTRGAAPDDVRVVVSKSPIVLRDIPVITNHCMGEIWENKTALSSYKTRHLIRKTLGVIITQLIKDGTTDLGEKVEKQEKTLEYANTGLFVLSMFDPTGIAWLLQDFVQPICGPTEYIGEVDDGPLNEALGLTTVDEAFCGSYGVWKKAGDGSVTIYFESVDKYDVDVTVRVAGTKVDQVRVPANGKATWTAHVKQLQDKTLYLDRWRPGLFGLPGTGGGSLLMWVPRSSKGGYLVLHARLNVS